LKVDAFKIKRLSSCRRIGFVGFSPGRPPPQTWQTEQHPTDLANRTTALRTQRMGRDHQKQKGNKNIVPSLACWLGAAPEGTTPRCCQ
jgi:hypothetical protein